MLRQEILTYFNQLNKMALQFINMYKILNSWYIQENLEDLEKLENMLFDLDTEKEKMEKIIQKLFDMVYQKRFEIYRKIDKEE